MATGTTVDTSTLATSTKQSDGSQKTQVVDGSGNVIGSTSNALDINVKNASLAVTGTFWQTTQPISAVSLPLPSLAATSTKQSDGSQKTQIVDGSGNVVGTTTIGSTNALIVANSGTNWVQSTNNSTTSQLTAGSTFTGTRESILNQNSVTVLVTSDQPGTLTLRQYIDAAGTFALPTIVVSVTAGTPINRAYALAGNYFNLTFQNTGAGSTTTLNINTYFGADLPTISDRGNQVVALSEVNGSVLSLGQTTKSASLPVTIASDSNGAVSPANSLPITFPRKQSVTGTTISTNTTNANLLDGSGSAAATDVRDYNSGVLVIVSTATTGSYTIQSAFDSSFTIDVQTLIVEELTSTTGGLITAAVTPTNATRRFALNLHNINYLRVNLTSGPSTGSITAYVVLSQAGYMPAIIPIQNSGGTLVTQGTFAAGSASVGNPFLIGGLAANTTPTVRSNGQNTVAMTDVIGRQVMEPGQIRNLTTRGRIALTSGTETTLLSAGGASIFLDLVLLVFANTSVTATQVDIRDSTGGTIVLSVNVAAGATVSVDVAQCGITQTTANNAWTAQCGTGVTTLFVTAVAKQVR